MSKHYFTVKSQGMWLVAHVHLRDPNTNTDSRSFEMGRAHRLLFANEAEIGKWADMMSKLSDHFMRAAIKTVTGHDIGEITTETLERNVPRSDN